MASDLQIIYWRIYIINGHCFKSLKNVIVLIKWFNLELSYLIMLHISKKFMDFIKFPL
jgi:hypothetical protein